MITQLNSRKATAIRLLMICLLSSSFVTILVVMAKRPLAATLTNHTAVQSTQGARRYQDLLYSRDQALRAVPRKISSEVYYSPALKKNVVTLRYLVPGKGETLVTAADEAAFLKLYKDALNDAERAIADFQGASANHPSKQ